jgi:hypothetical protein
MVTGVLIGVYRVGAESVSTLRVLTLPRLNQEEGVRETFNNQSSLQGTSTRKLHPRSSLISL